MIHAKCKCNKDDACFWPDCVEGPVGQEKRQLRDMLSAITQAYEKASKPYLDRLAALESLKMPTVRISYEEAVKAGFIKKEET
jgi:hypothetical protein